MLEEGGRRNERLFCPDHLEAELEIELRSDDGVLDAVIVTPVTLQAPDRMVLTVDVSDEDLGMLDWTPVEVGATLYLMLSYGTSAGSEGALQLHSGEGGDSEGVGTSVELATWTLE